MANEKLQMKIYNEGYCCPYGYLRLCRARGQTNGSIAKYQNLSIKIIQYNYRKVLSGGHKCQNLQDCLLPDIETIEKEKGQ